MYQAGNSVEQVFGGTVIKQGDRTPLGFNFRTENGELVTLTGSTVQVKVASDKGVVLEKQATISDEYTAQFAIGSQDITGAGDMRIEFIVTYPGGTIEKFPSDDWQRIRITPTLENVEKYGVAYISFEKMRSEFGLQFEEFTAGVEPRLKDAETNASSAINNSEQAVSLASSVQEQLNQVVIEGDSSVEAAQARVDLDGYAYSSLKNRVDDYQNKINNVFKKVYGSINVHEFESFIPNKTLIPDPLNWDWTQAFTAAIASISKGAIELGNTTYKVTGEINTNGKPIRFIGKGSSNTVITPQFSGTLFNWSGTKDSFISLSGLGLQGVTIEGGNYNVNAIKLVYTARGNFSDIVTNRVAGHGIYLRSVQDSTFENIYLRYCGLRANNTYALYMDKRDSTNDTNTVNNVNDNKFVNVTFEHDNGRLLYSEGDSNNCNVWMGCKFEYNNTTNTTYDEPIYLDGVDRYQFIACRYTHYKKKMFKIVNSQNVRIEGHAYNSTDPEALADVVDSYNIDVNVTGRKVGKVLKSGNSYGIYDSKVHDAERVYDSVYLMDDFNPLQSINLRNIHYKLEGATVVDDVAAKRGYAIKGGSGDNQKVVRIGLTKNDLTTSSVNIQLVIGAKSTSSKIYEVRVRNASNIDSIVATLTIGTTYGLYKVEIPASLLTKDSGLIINNTTNQVGNNLFIDGLHYEITSAIQGVNSDMFPRLPNETDDTGRLQRLFNASKTKNAAPIELKGEVFYVSDTVEYNSADKKPFIYGQGMKATMIDATGIANGKPAFKIKGGSGTMSGGYMKGIGFTGHAGSVGVQVSGTNHFSIEMCEFGLNALGVLLFNEAGTEFTEYVLIDKCNFKEACSTVIEYRQTNNVESFHGSGLKDCTINQSATESSPKILIGSGCLPYNAPLNFQVWTRIGTPIIRCISVKNVNFHGHITVESFDPASNGYKVEMCDSAYNQVILIGGMSAFDDQSQLGKLILADRVQTNPDGSMNIQRKRYQTTYVLTTGDNPTLQLDNHVAAMVNVSVRGTNYDCTYMLVVYRNSGDDNGTVTKLATLRMNNGAGYGEPTFSYTGKKLVITNTNFPTTGITAYVSVSEVGTRFNNYMK